jgi:hypothetical protein
MYRRRLGSERQGLSERGAEAEGSGAHGKQMGSPLARAAEIWLRRGYQLRYQDEHLVQVASNTSAPTRRDLLLAVGGSALLGICGALGLLAYLALARRGRRHVVSLLLTPERRVIAYRQWQTIPSEG